MEASISTSRDVQSKRFFRRGGLENNDNRNVLLDFIIDRAKKLFAIALLSGFDTESLIYSVMEQFMNESITDTDLPITKERL